MTFDEKQDLIKKNTDLKAVYGLNAPSLPRVLRKDHKEISDGHTKSVLQGYYKRVFNFLKAHPLNQKGHVSI
jgi:hypothetical protein